ncbi:hypothetical protein NQZ79_g6262 [Umbelopsis isabellina]|nr:hypothetical protein NQZ79_g6262 [Umbelopsis isabellina]
MPSTLPYREPSVKEILELSSFIYLLNVVRELFNLLHAGVVGELILGIVYGTPLTGILSLTWEQTMSNLGYIGLLIILFEGGLTSNIDQLIRTIWLSFLVAITGILCPIGISLIYLKYAYGYSSIEAFAAGASLSSTSLGTTYSVLCSANLSQSKVGVVLVSAALIDDIVGLVIAGIISLLASSSNSVNLGWTIARPLIASAALLTIPILITRYLLSPTYLKLTQHTHSRYLKSLHLFMIVGCLSAMTTIAYYAGTSSLLGGFMAGMIIGYLDTHLLETATETATLNSVFKTYIVPLQKTLLEPLFFASIGFAIPISDLFNVTVAWKGIAFGFISIVTKSIAGLWILLWPTSSDANYTPDVLQLEAVQSSQSMDNSAQPANGLPQSRTVRNPNCTRICRVPNEHSVLVSLLLGMSMIARGEIGLLISNIAYRENGPLRQESFLELVYSLDGGIRGLWPAIGGNLPLPHSDFVASAPLTYHQEPLYFIFVWNPFVNDGLHTFWNSLIGYIQIILSF